MATSNETIDETSIIAAVMADTDECVSFTKVEFRKAAEDRFSQRRYE